MKPDYNLKLKVLNIPEMTWIDLSREFRESRLITLKEAAASLGAEEDRGIGLPSSGLASLRASIEKAGVPLLYEDSLDASISERLAIYRQGASKPIKVLINVGGGSATTGPDAIDHYFEPGLSRAVAARAFTFPSVMGRFLADGIPVINLTEVKTLAFRYGLPYPPTAAEPIGVGGVYEGVTYRRWLAALMIVLLLALTAFVMRSAHIALAAEDGDGRRSKLRAKV